MLSLGADSNPRPARWILLALLFFGLVFNYIHRAALSVAAPTMIRELGFTKAQMGILLSAFFWSYSLMQVPVGWLSDRFGVRNLYGFSYAVWSLVCAASAAGASFMFVLVMRVLLGAGQASIFPASNRAIATWFPRTERGTATGVYLTGARLGVIILAPASAFILALWGWQSLFLIAGLAGLVWLIPWFWFFARHGAAAEAAQASSPAAGRPAIKQFFSLLRHRSVWGVSLGFFAYDYVWYLYVTWLPGYLALDRGFSLKQTGFLSALPMIAMSVMIPLSGLLSDWLIRRGRPELRIRKAFLVTGLLLCGLIVPAAFVKSAYTAVLLLTISLGGLGIASPNSWTLTIAVAPRKLVGTLSGIQNLAGNLGGVLSPAITGYIAHVTGSFVLALAFAGLVLVLGMIGYVFLVPGRIPEPAEASASA